MHEGICQQALLSNYFITWEAKYMSGFVGAVDCPRPGSSTQGISQARILERIAISFSRGPSQPKDQTRVSFFGRWIL